MNYITTDLVEDVDNSSATENLRDKYIRDGLEECGIILFVDERTYTITFASQDEFGLFKLRYLL